MFPIEGNRPPHVGKFIKNVNSAWGLNERKLPGVIVKTRYSGRITILLNRIIDRFEGSVGAERGLAALNFSIAHGVMGSCSGFAPRGSTGSQLGDPPSTAQTPEKSGTPAKALDCC